MVLFSGCQKRCFSAHYRIDFDNEDVIICDENSNNFDDYGNENDQKQTNTMALNLSQNIPHFRH